MLFSKNCFWFSLVFALVPGIGVPAAESSTRTITLFLAGDVMTGRGIDQILPYPSNPVIYERHAQSAQEYVALAESVNGAIQRPVNSAYIWGDALIELQARAPDRRIINLETSITTSPDAQPKGINYRMNPRNMPALQAADIDCAVLANNHVLDWGSLGLKETVDSLQKAGIAAAGAGHNATAAARPAVLTKAGNGRVLVFGFGLPTSGIPHSWSATKNQAGVNLLPELSPESADGIADEIRRQRRQGDVVVVSIHWGGNWGYDIPHEQREFAHRLIDSGMVDVVHGHSSHHPKGIECYHERLILYGCGDFINDYEGISGYDEFRGGLVLGYFAALDAGSGRLARLSMVPFRSVRFRLQCTARSDAKWLRDMLNREGKQFGTSVTLTTDNTLMLHW